MCLTEESDNNEKKKQNLKTIKLYKGKCSRCKETWKQSVKDENEKKIFRNSTYQLNQHNEYNKYPDHAVRGWHPAAE